MRITDLETPALLIDLDIMERNLRRAAEYTRAHHLRLRPHTKTHKTPALARRQLDLGAVGLTVAKVGEAEVMLGAQPPGANLLPFASIGLVDSALTAKPALAAWDSPRRCCRIRRGG